MKGLAMKEFLLLVTNIVLLVLSENISNSTCGDRCCLNFYKDKFDGSCVECPLGTHGRNCTGTCPPQYYGLLCQNKCECPFNLCDKKFGCMDFQTTNGGDNPWKYVALTLIGSLTIMVAVGLMMLMKSWFAKRFKKETIVSNESQTGMNNLIPNGNRIEENKYEEQRSSLSPDEIETLHVYNMSAENNYADLRTSVLSRIYDNPGDFETDLTQRTLMLIRPWLNRNNI